MPAPVRHIADIAGFPLAFPAPSPKIWAEGGHTACTTESPNSSPTNPTAPGNPQLQAHPLTRSPNHPFIPPSSSAGSSTAPSPSSRSASTPRSPSNNSKSGTTPTGPSSASASSTASRPSATRPSAPRPSPRPARPSPTSPSSPTPPSPRAHASPAAKPPTSPSARPEPPLPRCLVALMPLLQVNTNPQSLPGTPADRPPPAPHPLRLFVSPSLRLFPPTPTPHSPTSRPLSRLRRSASSTSSDSTASAAVTPAAERPSARHDSK